MARGVKLLFDVVVALTVLVLFAPVMAVVALTIWLTMGRPILFRQVRPGYRARPFTLLKFRTMREAYGPDGRPLPDSRRLTAVGRFLRRTSLDELPQLWNVLRGEMSIVGPRPLLPEYLPCYTERERLRFTARPGLTGWAQVNGRNSLAWDERLEKDAWYAERWSPWLDLEILARTVGVILFGTGQAVDSCSVLPALNEERQALGAGRK